MSEISDINDRFTTTLIGGQVVLTQGILALGDEQAAAALRMVKEFNVFTEDNDPYGEHDFGSFVLDKKTIYWKIDYYDMNLEFRSEDPSNEAKTTRVLTVMLADEY
jgi:hypothetical protein